MDNKTIKQAESIDPKDRLSEIEKNLLLASENKTIAAKQLKEEIKNANEAIAETVKNSGLGMTDQQKLMQTVQQVNSLLARARKGENVISELNKLKL